MPLRKMTPEEAAEFRKKHPLNTTIIFGVKPPKWWLEKYGTASKQEPQATKPDQAKPNQAKTDR